MTGYMTRRLASWYSAPSLQLVGGLPSDPIWASSLGAAAVTVDLMLRICKVQKPTISSTMIFGACVERRDYETPGPCSSGRFSPR